MSVDIQWRCDTCRSHLPKESILAVVFDSTDPPFKLLPSTDTNFRHHQGVHICINCCAGIVKKSKGLNIIQDKISEK